MPIVDRARNLFKKVVDVLCCCLRSENTAADDPNAPLITAADAPHSTETPPPASTDSTRVSPETTPRASTPSRFEAVLPSTPTIQPAEDTEDQVLSAERTDKFLETFQKTYSDVQAASENPSLPSLFPTHLYMGAFLDACYHSALLPEGLTCNNPAIDGIIDHCFRKAVERETPPEFHPDRFTFHQLPAPSVTYKMLRDNFEETPFKYLHPEHRWRFSIETNVIEDLRQLGILKEKENFLKPLIYDNEPGYFHRMNLTWKDVFLNVGEPLLIDDLIRWNTLCNGENSFAPTTLGGYGVPLSDITPQGNVEIGDFFTSCKNHDGEPLVSANFTDINVMIIRRKTTENHLKKIMDQVIDEYYEEIGQSSQHTSNREDQVLQAAVRMAQKLHRIHPFKRGNSRTFYVAMLNKLLLDEDLPMSMPNCPWLIDGSSVEEAVEIVKDGQKYLQDFGYPSTSQANQVKIPPTHTHSAIHSLPGGVSMEETTQQLLDQHTPTRTETQTLPFYLGR